MNHTTESYQLYPTCLPCLPREAEPDHASTLLHSPNPSLLPERDLHLAAPSHLALGQDPERQAEPHQLKVKDEMESDLEGIAAEAQQDLHQGAGAAAELDDDTENAVTRGLQAVSPLYPRVQR